MTSQLFVHKILYQVTSNLVDLVAINQSSQPSIKQRTATTSLLDDYPLRNEAIHRSGPKKKTSIGAQRQHALTKLSAPNNLIHVYQRTSQGRKSLPLLMITSSHIIPLKQLLWLHPIGHPNTKFVLYTSPLVGVTAECHGANPGIDTTTCASCWLFTWIPLEQIIV